MRDPVAEWEADLEVEEGADLTAEEREDLTEDEAILGVIEWRTWGHP